MDTLLKLLLIASLSLPSSGDKRNSTVFSLAFKWELVYEGPCSNDYGDPGGLTCWGITHSEYDRWRDRKGLKRRSIYNMPVSEAQDIYYSDYWIRTGIYRLPMQLAIAVFDWEVNSGRGVRDLQQQLGLPHTGYVDDITLAKATASTNSPDRMLAFLDKYFSSRNSSYYRFASYGQEQFLSGWISRSSDLQRKLTKGQNL